MQYSAVQCGAVPANGGGSRKGTAAAASASPSPGPAMVPVWLAAASRQPSSTRAALPVAGWRLPLPQKFARNMSWPTSLSTAAFAPATEASQRSALSRRRSGLRRQRSHRARPHSGRDRAARRTAAHTVHLYLANNRGGAARRRIVIGTTWPRRRRKSAAARMTPRRRWAQNDVVRSEVGTNCAAGLAALRAARDGRSNARSRVARAQDSYKRSCGWCG
eukprot:COSAG06_NODE_5036_length_3770_cov_13.868973_2_plen_219_part_00